MRPEQRRHEIIELLIREGAASLESMARAFEVSTMTIHRDLDDLESAGLLRKIRGGATIEAGGFTPYLKARLARERAAAAAT